MASKLHNALAKKLPDIQMSEAFINCVFFAMSGSIFIFALNPLCYEYAKTKC